MCLGVADAQFRLLVVAMASIEEGKNNALYPPHPTLPPLPLPHKAYR